MPSNAFRFSFFPRKFEERMIGSLCVSTLEFTMHIIIRLLVLIFSLCTALLVLMASKGKNLSISTAVQPLQVDTLAWTEASVQELKTAERFLRIVTFNVWFESFYIEERFDALVLIIINRTADVVCLQEVTPKIEAAIRTSKVITDQYDMSPYPVDPYGVMILAKKSLSPSFREVVLPSEMGRKLLLAELGSNGDCPNWLEKSAVATVHLESLNMAPYRRRQLQVCAKELAPYQGRSVLCGDFNFDDTQEWGDWRTQRAEGWGGRGGGGGGGLASISSSPRRLENEVLSEVFGASFVDQWPFLRPGERGATFDGGTNPQCVRDSLEVMRYDRMMLSTGATARELSTPFQALASLRNRARSLFSGDGDASTGPLQWQGERIQMLGTDAINEIGIKPSDHYGLELDIRPKAEAAAR
jgi:endonuclease/exonuclease/phosphatase (EEP) superfamily protein YafD